ncbi:hypothetical protein F5Y11DRAFT_338004 [Daldinia sp. FL1419]|nr:hypothetical protein F5Y11DRAFT_338004 [Daldinia sp. FL1419]
MKAAGLGFCQFCGVPLQRVGDTSSDEPTSHRTKNIRSDNVTSRRTSNISSNEPIIIPSDDESDDHSPTKLVKRINPRSYEDSNMLSPADQLAVLRRPRPNPRPLLPKTEFSIPPMTQVPASSEALREAQRSSKKHLSSSNAWFHFNLSICIVKFTLDENDELPMPLFVHNSLETLYNYDTAVRGERIFGIHDWWERLASQNFQRKKDLDKAYPITFYKTLTNRAFTNLNIEAENAEDVRTIWNSLLPTKSQNGKEHRKIFVAYQKIRTIPKVEADLPSPDIRTKVEDDFDNMPIKLEDSRPIKAERLSPMIKAESQEDSLFVRSREETRKRKASASMSAGSGRPREPPQLPQPLQIPEPQELTYESEKSLTPIEEIFGLPRRPTPPPRLATPKRTGFIHYRVSSSPPGRDKSPTVSSPESPTPKVARRTSFTAKSIDENPKASPASEATNVANTPPDINRPTLEDASKDTEKVIKKAVPVRSSSRTNKAVPARRFGE